MLSHRRILELFNYDAESGILTWKISTSNRAKVGSIAGCRHNCGYRQIKVDGQKYLEHRLIWLYVTGEWPKDQIDHINGARDDNRFSNLREATNAENQRNRTRSSTNSSGHKGVHWRTDSQCWQARIMLNKEYKHLGYFDTLEDAHTAYVAAAKELYGEFARFE
jgi:hypothetical protein